MNHCIYLTLGAQAGTTSACAQPSQMPEPQWTFRNRLLNEEGEIKEGFPEEMAFELRLEEGQPEYQVHTELGRTKVSQRMVPEP